MQMELDGMMLMEMKMVIFGKYFYIISLLKKNELNGYIYTFGPSQIENQLAKNIIDTFVAFIH